MIAKASSSFFSGVAERSRAATLLVSVQAQIMESWATPVQNVGTDAPNYSTLSRKGSSGILSGLLGPEASIAALAKTVSVLSLTQYRPDPLRPMMASAPAPLLRWDRLVR